MFNIDAPSPVEDVTIIGMEIFFDSVLEKTLDECSVFDASDADGLSLGSGLASFKSGADDDDDDDSNSSGSDSSGSSLSSSDYEEDEDDMPSRADSISLGRLNQLYNSSEDEQNSDDDDDDDATLGGATRETDEYSHLALSKLDLSDMAVMPKKRSSQHDREKNNKNSNSNHDKNTPDRRRRTRRRSKGTLKKLAVGESPMTLKQLTLRGAMAQTA